MFHKPDHEKRSIFRKPNHHKRSMFRKPDKDHRGRQSHENMKKQAEAKSPLEKAPTPQQAKTPSRDDMPKQSANIGLGGARMY